jgi:hypothetical protein
VHDTIDDRQSHRRRRATVANQPLARDLQELPLRRMAGEGRFRE